MIKNERQYRITKAQVRRFEEALEGLSKRATEHELSILAKAEADAVRSQWEELRSDVEEYEDLKAGRLRVLEVDSLGELPAALIKARIASGMSQKKLADRLGLKEQQIQRYEATDYSAANLERLIAVADCLGVRVREGIILPSAGISLGALLSKSKKVGIDEDFLLTRIVPPAVSEELRSCDLKDDSGLVFRVASAIERALGWPIPDLLTEGPPRAALAGFGGFKIPRRTDERRLLTYAFYANTLALLLLRSAKDLRPGPIPHSAASLRAEILKRFGRVTLENALLFVWGKGVAVLPLNDSGAFHGACWKVGELAVIALNQSTQASARWLFDVLHELYHILQAEDSPDFSLIERAPISPTSEESEEEIEANNFAEDVMLDGRADELADLCVRRARNRVELLKAVVPEVAKQENVEPDALANHLAYRLADQDIDWWGAATNLQVKTPRPVEVARAVLFERIDLGRLERYDRELFLRSQTERV